MMMIDDSKMMMNDDHTVTGSQRRGVLPLSACPAHGFSRHSAHDLCRGTKKKRQISTLPSEADRSVGYRPILNGDFVLFAAHAAGERATKKEGTHVKMLTGRAGNKSTPFFIIY